MARCHASGGEWKLTEREKLEGIDSYHCSKSQDNAQFIYSFFKEHGWSTPAIMGLLGNTTWESYNNPGFHERGGDGFGIVQWTPASEYKDWAKRKNYPCGKDYSNPERYLRAQCEKIQWEYVHNEQWIPTRQYAMSFDKYIHREDMTPSNAAAAFCWCYERPNRRLAHLYERSEFAQHWDATLLKDVRESVTPTDNVTKKAVQWAVQTAQDPSHGYTQAQGKRFGPTDYDCSSFVITAYRKAGLSLSGASYTGDMREAMLAEDFEIVNAYVNRYTCEGMNAGDVLLNEAHHAAIYIGGGQLAQASISESGIIGITPGDQTGREINISRYYNYPWDYILRYVDSGQSGGDTAVGSSGVSVVRAIPAGGTHWTEDINRN